METKNRCRRSRSWERPVIALRVTHHSWTWLWMTIWMLWLMLDVRTVVSFSRVESACFLKQNRLDVFLSRTFPATVRLTSNTNGRFRINDDSPHPNDSRLRVYGWRNCIPRHPTALFMGKGDGKKKRKKKEEKTDPPLSTSSPSPLRVLSTVNIPVRQQIALANMNKMVRTDGAAPGGGSFKPRVRTAYRRTWDEEEVEQKAEERKRRGQEPNWDVILNRTAVDPLLIVDGYNIIYAWPRLKKHMIKGDTARARQLLLDDLENLQSIKGWRIECVFDGTRRATSGPLGSTSSGAGAGGGGSMNPMTRGLDQATKASVSKYGVRVVYSGVGTEADAYIESRCLRAKNVTQGEITGSLIVATDDAMIRLVGQNAGAVCMSAPRFVEELKAIQKVISYRVEAAVAKVNGHAIRPEPLRGAAPTRFGRRSVVIEDKRNRTKVSKKLDETVHSAYAIDVSTIQLEEDENGVPWWAQVPEQSNFLKG